MKVAAPSRGVDVSLSASWCAGFATSVRDCEQRPVLYAALSAPTSGPVRRVRPNAHFLADVTLLDGWTVSSYKTSVSLVMFDGTRDHAVRVGEDL
jgi:hypothetical protein